MKYLNKYNESVDHHAIVKIKSEFSEETIAEMLSEEIKEWSDDDTYHKNSNGEAEEIVLHQIISWYKKEFNKQLSDNEQVQLEQALKQEYKVLN
jgi:hypothetical protein